MSKGSFPFDDIATVESLMEKRTMRTKLKPAIDSLKNYDIPYERTGSEKLNFGNKIH